ncbi:uncharacterized protein METZ01_LOCUS361037, partial [marine metagenome]
KFAAILYDFKVSSMRGVKTAAKKK